MQAGDFVVYEKQPKWGPTDQDPNAARATFTVNKKVNGSTVSVTAWVDYVGSPPSQQAVQDRVMIPDTIENRMDGLGGRVQTALLIRASSLFAGLTANQKQRIMAVIDAAAQDAINAIAGAS